MADPLILYSRVSVTREELGDLILSKNGAVIPDGSKVGSLSDGNRHIWIFLSNEEIAYLEEDQKRTVTDALNGPPLTCVTVEISRKTGSEQIAVDFAFAFMQKWAAIAVAPTGKLYRQEEIVKLQKAGEGFR